ncbi:MAG: transcription antitermination factor NusB [Bdellovibrionota bacterium]
MKNNRRTSRELALKWLYQTDFKGNASVAELASLYSPDVSEDSFSYAQELIQGIDKNLAAIDEKIQAASRHWKLDRMASVDKNIMRLSTYEMAFAAELVPHQVAISEALELAKLYGTSDSTSFVNGVLDQVAQKIKS